MPRSTRSRRSSRPNGEISPLGAACLVNVAPPPASPRFELRDPSRSMVARGTEFSIVGTGHSNGPAPAICTYFSVYLQRTYDTSLVGVRRDVFEQRGMDSGAHA